MSFNEFLGLVMLVSMMGVIFIGFPISFTLLFLAFIFGSIGVGADQNEDRHSGYLNHLTFIHFNDDLMRFDAQNPLEELYR